jgi:hypothetical protein
MLEAKAHRRFLAQFDTSGSHWVNHHDTLTYETIYVAADLHRYDYAKHESVRGEAEGCILDALRCLAISHDLCQVIVNNLVYRYTG